MFRYITKPDRASETVNRLKEVLEIRHKCSEHRWPGKIFDYNQDFLLYPPPPSQVIHAPSEYAELYAFKSVSKGVQRQRLENWGLPTPQLLNAASELPNGFSGYVLVRPHRHSGGEGYSLYSNLEVPQWNPSTHYGQIIFKKTHEYRVITVYGTPLITLRKKNPNNLSYEQPWNHSNGCFFSTIDEPMLTCRLRTTNVYEKLRTIPIIKVAPLVGIDVLYDKHTNTYVVPEVNLLPGITIEENLITIRDQLLRSRTSNATSTS